MQSRVTARLSWPGITAAFCSVLVILLGLIVLTGWAIRSLFLIQVAPNFAPMQPITAVSFVLSGIALLCILMARPHLTAIASAIIAALSLASLFEYVFHISLGIDRFLGVASITTLAPFRGRMSPTTALCFAVFALVTMLARQRRFTKRSSLLGVAGLLIA